MVTKLGKDNSDMLFGASGTMEQNERVHISKGTLIYAFGYAGVMQQFVVYDDNMNAVEICNGNPDEIDEHDLKNYFSPIHKLEETTRPISKQYGIGFYYDESDEVISDEVIERSLKRAENLAKLEKEVKERKEKEAEELKIKTLEKYSFLQKANTRFDHKVCGQNIRTELKRNFPSVKFSVRYESFSGGDAYRIGWTDGPTTKQVDTVVGKYADTHKDYTSDYWDCKPSCFNDIYGSVSYVTTNRNISEGTFAKVMQEHNTDRGGARNILWDMDLTPKEQPKPEHKEVVSGSFEIIDYSEKAIAVIGDTKSIKDQLKAIGGRFNGKLSCGAGWIFPKSKRGALEAIINA